MLDLTLSQVFKAKTDIAASARKWRVWHMLAWQEIRQRYRRSTFGPFWLTLSMGVQIAVMGVVVSSLFGQEFHKALPYVALGFIFWNMISGIVNDGAMSFVGANNWILQINLPLGTYVFQKIWSNTIAMAHNLAIFVVLVFIYRIYSFSFLLFVLMLPLVLVSLAWAPLLLAIVSTRFRDLPAIVTNSFSLLFWLTPIVYRPEQLGPRAFIVELNPLTHMLALLRDPLLGQMPSVVNLEWVCATAIVGWTITFPFYARFRGRIAYWL
ncbi:MAG TPA: ABC transporter permease [Xanthobacteraceae bacterium]|nr:ABC transporter permease [Xanthobacteraceae bacterium]HUN98673.1 ABC transporter permease [Bradyrhizobium sp.]